MARNKGTANVSFSFEVNSASPLDTRDVVEFKADLTDADTWTKGGMTYSYEGMGVYVQEEKKRYILKGDDPTVLANWQVDGADYDDTALQAEMLKKAEGYIETNTETIKVGDTYTFVQDQIVTVTDGTNTYTGVVDDLGAVSIDIGGNVITLSTDGTGVVVLDNPAAAVFDENNITVVTETIHKIDSRLLPKGAAVDTQDYLQDVLTVKEAQGNYKVGDIIPKDTSLEDIVKNMLLKTNYPTLTDPKATLTNTGVRLLETGATQNTTFTITFDRGKIEPQYTSASPYRVGEATAYDLNNMGEQAGNTFDVVVSESNAGPFTGLVKYAAGVEPKTDTDEKAADAAPAGQVNTNALSFEFVDAWHSNAANNGTIAKMPLVSKGAGTRVLDFAPMSGTSPFVFDVPATWNVTAVKFKNTLNNQWEDNAQEWAISDVTHTNAGGATVNYKRYTNKKTYAQGERSMQISFN